MLYKCEHCNYSTKRLCDLRRHENRKYPCNRKKKVDTCNLEDGEILTNDIHNVTDSLCNVTEPFHNVTVDIHNVTGNIHNVTDDIHNVTDDINNVGDDLHTVTESIKTKFQCEKCNKYLSSKNNLKIHQKKCDGLHPRQCRICLKIFATRQGKYEHMKYVKCKPPTSCMNINGDNNNNTYNNITNNITNNINNNININFRGDFDRISNEDIHNIVSQLEQSEYLKMISHNMDIGKYVIPRTME